MIHSNPSVNSKYPKSSREYHEEWLAYLIQTASSAQADYASGRKDLFYNGYDPNEAHNFLLSTISGQPIPVRQEAVNYIRPLIEHQVGEFIMTEMSLDAQIISGEAISRALEGKSGIMAQFDMMPFYSDIQEISQMQIISPGMPKTPQERDMMISEFKEKGQLAIERMAMHHYKVTDMETRRGQFYLEAYNVGSTFALVHDDYGFPDVEKVDSEFMLIPPNLKNPYGKDAEYAVIARYLSIAEVKQRFGVTDAELKALRDQDQNAVRFSGGANPHGYGFGSVPRWNRSLSGENSVLVIQAYWLDSDEKRVAKRKGKRGEDVPFVQKASKSLKKHQEEIGTYHSQQVRYCVSIGGSKILRKKEGRKEHFGILKNQARGWGDDFTTASLPVKMYLPWLHNGVSMPPMEDAMKIAKKINDAFIMIARNMRGDLGSIPFIDTSQLPKDMTFYDVMSLMQLGSPIPFTSKGIGNRTGYNNVMQYNLGLNQSTGFYWEYIQGLKMELKEILDAVDVRTGTESVSGEKTGAHRQRLTQASKRSMTLKKGMHLFMGQIYDHVVRLMRDMIMNDPDRYSYIVGDDLVEFLKTNPDFYIKDKYGVVLEFDNMQEERIAVGHDLVRSMVLSQTLPPHLALNMLYSRNPQELESRLKQWYEVNREEQRQMQQQQQQMEMMMQQQMQQQAAQDAQAKFQLDQMKIQSGMQIADMNNQAKIQTARMDNSTIMRELERGAYHEMRLQRQKDIANMQRVRAQDAQRTRVGGGKN